ncbi:MAG: hypothetical protein NC299_18210 [Lachnospiraceae bacterium]|nr:hypothetical protein [Ruminococcus sp.]MCM1277263.1 hypothetical protein [Lachnospiraceae bacterium]
MANQKSKKYNMNFVNCSRLSVGMEVDNYPAMCKLLGEPERSGGNSIKAHKKKWQRFFKYEQNGHRFTILEIYETPLPDRDKRREKFGIYAGYIRFLLLKCVLQTKDNCLILPKYQWWERLSMVNGNFNQYLPCKDRELSNGELKVANSEKNRFSELERKIAEKYNLPIDSNDVSFFYELAQGKLREILNNALKSLKNKRLINCDDIFKIRMADGSIEYVTNSEKKLMGEILDLQNQALDKIGFRSYQNVVAANQTFRYYRELQLLAINTHLVEGHPELSWNNIYELTRIVFSKNRRELERQLFLTVEELLEDDTLESEYKQGLNENVVKALTDLIRDERISCLGDPNIMDFTKRDGGITVSAESLYHNEKFKNKVRNKDKFVEIQNSLIDCLIAIDY